MCNPGLSGNPSWRRKRYTTHCGVNLGPTHAGSAKSTLGRISEMTPEGWCTVFSAGLDSLGGQDCTTVFTGNPQNRQKGPKIGVPPFLAIFSGSSPQYRISDFQIGPKSAGPPRPLGWPRGGNRTSSWGTHPWSTPPGAWASLALRGWAGRLKVPPRGLCAAGTGSPVGPSAQRRRPDLPPPHRRRPPRRQGCALGGHACTRSVLACGPRAS